MAIRLGESHFREFKSAIERSPEGEKPRDVKLIAKDIGETLVAFANADGGELIVGLEDNGKTTGIPHSDDQLTAMMDAPNTYVHRDTPLATPRILKLPIARGAAAGRYILYFSVPKGTEHVHLTNDGRCLQRHDRETRPVPAERIQYDRQERRSREYDREFIDGVSTGHLDSVLLAKVVQKINPAISPEKALQFLDLAEYEPLGLRLRRAALLLFASDVSRWHPRSQVRIVRVAGTTIGVGREYNVSKDDTVQGNILGILSKTWDVLRPHLAVTRLGPHVVFQETLIYPEDACMEALINALAHRDYSIEGRGIEVFIFDDRMEIVSPGGLLSTITIDQLKRLTKVHQSRNAYIARVLRELGYMRELGEGIPRIFRAMEERDIVPPDIWSKADTFGITLYHRSVFSPKDQQWLDSLSQFNLSRDEQRVLLLGKDGHLITPREIRETLKIIDTEDYRKIVESLQRKGLLYSVRPDSQLRQKFPAYQRKDIGRFAIRPIGELQHFYDELTRVLSHILPCDHISGAQVRQALYRLSPRNPYCRTVTECTLSLRYLGFIDGEGRPLQLLLSLWQTRRPPR
jgi:ATP-dependent DNA helicase RecG